MAVKFQQKNIEDATAPEIRSYATVFLGIPGVDEMTDSEVLSKIRAATSDDNIWFVPEEEIDQTGSPPPPPADVPQSQLQGGLGRQDPRVLITLHAEERDGVVNNRHKEIGVNGVVWLIKRGEPVEVPYRVYLALNDAVRDNVTHDKDGNEIHQKVHSVPFSVQRSPSAAEIEEFHRRTRDVFCPA